MAQLCLTPHDYNIDARNYDPLQFKPFRCIKLSYTFSAGFKIQIL